MKLDKLLPYHTELNPKVWDGQSLRPEIRDKLLTIAEAFKGFIDVPHLEVFDVILTGSMANYNWTNKSDFDLHLMVDYDQADGDLAEKFFKAKKELWNSQHDITILGYDVELYAQDVKEHHISSGTYSLERNEWIVKPKYEKPDVNSLAVKIKFNSMVHMIERAMLSNHIVEVEQARDKVRKMRQAGLQSKGEFSTENLVFKLLRNEGYLDRLWEYSNDLMDRQLSMETIKEFAPSSDGREEPGDDEILRKLAAQWWHGDEDPRAEQALAAMGWEIGQDESGEPGAAVFLVRVGDVNGNSYMAYHEDDLTEAVNKEDAAGVGIITKQNTTKDVNKGTLRKMMKGYKLI